MMRDENGRGTVMRAVGQVRVRPYRSLREMYFGIRKTVLAQFGNSAALSAAAAVVLVVAGVAPAVLVLAAVPLWWSGAGVPLVVVPSLLAALFPMVGLLKARTLLRFEPLAALLFPVGAIVIATSALHAAVVFAVKGTVEWRGRSYTRKDFENSAR